MKLETIDEGFVAAGAGQEMNADTIGIIISVITVGAAVSGLTMTGFRHVREDMDRRFAELREDMDRRFSDTDGRFTVLREDIREVRRDVNTLREAVGALRERAGGTAAT